MNRRFRFVAVLTAVIFALSACSSEVPGSASASAVAGQRTGPATPTDATATTTIGSGRPSAPATADVTTPGGTETPTPGGTETPTPGGTDAPSATPTPGSSQTPATPGVVRLMAAGDTMLARSIGKRLLKDPDAPFAGVAATFARADLVLLNLECTISDRGTPNAIKTFTFRAPPVSAKSLSNAGVDVVSLANNHAMDYGPKALADTISLLAAQGIGTIGGGADSSQARAPLILERNGLRIAFLAYLGVFHDASGWSAFDWEATPDRPGLALARLGNIRRDVTSAKRQADVVVVMFHAGLAITTVPTAFQRQLADTAISAGASLVINASPHVLQGTRRAGSTFVAYSMGNFVFDQSRGFSNDSAILDVTLDKSGVRSVRFVPILIHNGFPKRATGADAARIKRRLGPT